LAGFINHGLEAFFVLPTKTGSRYQICMTEREDACVLQYGWHLASDTAVELVGAACDNWKQPENLAIDFRFPCELIID